MRIISIVMLTALPLGCAPLEPSLPVPCFEICRPARPGKRVPTTGEETSDNRSDPVPVMRLDMLAQQAPCDRLPIEARKVDRVITFGAGRYQLRFSACTGVAAEAGRSFEVGPERPRVLSLTAAFDGDHADDGVVEFCLTKSALDRVDPAVDPRGRDALSAWWWSDLLRIERVCLPPDEIAPDVLAALLGVDGGSLPDGGHDGAP